MPRNKNRIDLPIIESNRKKEKNQKKEKLLQNDKNNNVYQGPTLNSQQNYTRIRKIKWL